MDPSTDGALAQAFERYAIFWTPAEGSPFARLGRRWLEAEPTLADHLGVHPAELEAATAEPRRYGLHATLHAPFPLRPQHTAASLNDQLRCFAAGRPALPLGPLRLERIGSFLALVAPDERESRLRGLHIQCLFAFESFRDENSLEDAARRAIDASQTTQKLLVAQWGYAHVLHLFRFHVTLTGRLETAALDALSERLAPVVEELNQAPVLLDALCLFGDPGNGQPLQPIARHRLNGPADD